jgi:succinoglycan biosynthesis protein ExoM
VHVTVAMLTYRRPTEVVRTLTAVLAQLDEVAGQPGRAVVGDVVVVDNDPAASARDVLARYPAARYVHEPQPGIARARNAALAATRSADLLVFIDDDEIPEPGWLAALLAVWRADPGVGGVVGRVVSTFDVAPTPWVTAGGFFRRRSLATGTPVQTAATNNLLLNMDVVRRLDLWFDDSLGRSGGEDTLFTRTLVRGGARLVWCDEAVVVDVVPAERVTRSFVCGRAWAHGCTSVRIDVRMARDAGERVRVRLRAALAGALRIAGGTARVVDGIVTGRIERRARGVRTVLRGIGMVTGAAGLVVEEYAETGPRVRREGRRPSATTVR